MKTLGKTVSGALIGLATILSVYSKPSEVVSEIDKEKPKRNVYEVGVNAETLMDASDKAGEVESLAINRLMVIRKENKLEQRFEKTFYAERTNDVPVYPSSGLILFHVRANDYMHSHFIVKVREDGGKEVFQLEVGKEIDLNKRSDLYPFRAMCVGFFSPRGYFDELVPEKQIERCKSKPSLFIFETFKIDHSRKALKTNSWHRMPFYIDWMTNRVYNTNSVFNRKKD